VGQGVIHPVASCGITHLSYATEQVENDSELVRVKGLACLSISCQPASLCWTRTGECPTL
jgi:hypothetical protein